MAATKEEARAARDAKLDELHEKLTGAVETLVTGSDWARALAFAARFRSRSFNNTLLIWAQHEQAFEHCALGEAVRTGQAFEGALGVRADDQVESHAFSVVRLQVTGAVGGLALCVGGGHEGS